MGRNKGKNLIPQFASFEAAYCSGFFIGDNSLVTTMCLLFDKIWLLNHVELVIEFAKKFCFIIQDNELVPKIRIEPASPDAAGEDPLAPLTPEQRKTAEIYIGNALNFCRGHASLIEEHVLCTDLFPDGEVFEIELIKKGLPGRKNTYSVKPKGMIISSGGDVVKELDTLVSRGAVPLLSRRLGKSSSSNSSLRPKYLSSLLAMKTVELTLPQMKSARSDTIIEARERLRDLLPPFWGSMFRLSTDFKEYLEQGGSLHNIEQECEDYIDTTVRPALIELNSKLEKDRKSWFHKILSTTAKETKLIIGKPPLSVAGLVSTGLQLGANVTMDIVQSESDSHETGLTYLIELDKLIRKRK